MNYRPDDPDERPLNERYHLREAHYRRFGLAVRAAREQRGISLKALAVAIGVSVKTLKDIEDALEFTKAHVLIRLCTIFELDPFEYFATGHSFDTVKEDLKERMQQARAIDQEIARLKKKRKTVMDCP